MMMRPQIHRIYLIMRIAAKQTIVRVKMLCRKCYYPIDMMRQGYNHQYVGTAVARANEVRGH